MNLNRRDFLKALGIGTAGAAVGVKAEMPSSVVEKPEAGLKPVAHIMRKGHFPARQPVYRIEVDSLEIGRRCTSMGHAPLSERRSGNTYEAVVGFPLTHEAYGQLKEYLQQNRTEKMTFDFVVQGEMIRISAYLKEFNVVIARSDLIMCNAVFEDGEILT